MDWPVIAILFIGAAAIVPAMLLTAQTWEFRRFVRSRVGSPKVVAQPIRVTLFAPCKGNEPGLKDNLRPLFEQNLPDYRLVLVVESSNDPACDPIHELMTEHPQLRSKLVVAGLATTSGQKVHNLLVATAEIDDVDVLAFVDSDARPKHDWLRQLVQHLNHPQAAAATGYRWFVPVRNTLPNLLLHSLNAAVASLVGPGRHHMVWGGAWAIRRDVFEQVGLRDAWEGTLSDDLVAATVLARLDKKLTFEPACMTASPVEATWRSMFEFVRRQYTVARFYSPTWWLLGLLFCSISQVAFWGGLLTTAIGWATSASWTWFTALMVLAMYATYGLRAAIRQNAARSFLPELQDRLTASRWFDIVFSPLAGLANWLGLLGSLWGNCITWRCITYALQRGGNVRILRRTESTVDGQVLPVHMPFRKAG